MFGLYRIIAIIIITKYGIPKFLLQSPESNTLKNNERRRLSFC